MKALGITIAVVAVGSLLFWMTQDGASANEPAQAPPPVDEEPIAEEPVALAMPPEMEEEFEEPEVVSEEIPRFRDLGIDPEEVTKPRILGRKKLPDGRVEVRILSPIYYGNGEKKVVIRVLRASPRQMKRDTVQMRVPLRPNQKAPSETTDSGSGEGGLKKQGE